MRVNMVEAGRWVSGYLLYCHLYTILSTFYMFKTFYNKGKIKQSNTMI